MACISRENVHDRSLAARRGDKLLGRRTGETSMRVKPLSPTVQKKACALSRRFRVWDLGPWGVCVCIYICVCTYINGKDYIYMCIDSKIY